MLPLSLANIGEEQIIKKIGGDQEMKKHLEDLGFSVGSTVTIINSLGGNIIVKANKLRIAISREMAQKIMV